MILNLRGHALTMASDIEASWESVLTEAVARAHRRGDNAPYVRFRTSSGIAGALPVVPGLELLSERSESAVPSELDTIVAIDPGSNSPVERDSYTTPDVWRH